MFEIKALNDSGKYEKARDVWLKAREKGLVVDEYVYATVLSTYRHLNDYEGALGIYDEIRMRGIHNSFIESQIVDIYAKQGGTVQLAVEKLYSCLKEDIEIKPYAYYSVLRALVQSGHSGEAVGMVIQHTRVFELLDRFYWSSVVSAFTSGIQSTESEYSSTEKMDSAKLLTDHREGMRGLLKHILETNVQLPQPSWLALLSYFGDAAHESKSDLTLYNRAVTHLESIGALGLSTLIADKMEKNDAAGALDVWALMKRTPTNFSANAFSHLISVCAASGHVEQVEEIYNAMIEAGFEANSTVLAAMVRLYASNLRENEAQRYFDILLSKPTYVSPFLFNTMLDMYADLSNSDAALKVLDKMTERRMKLNASTYNALIVLYLRTSQPDKAAQAYKDMVKSKVPCNFATFRPFLIAADSSIPRETLLKDIKASKFISDTAKDILKNLKVNQL